MTRGLINLEGHKFAGLYRPAMKSGHKRRKPIPTETATLRQIARIVDGAIRDALACHPEYLTPRGRRNAQASIGKRVTGALNGYATQVARGRSGVRAAAAETGDPFHAESPKSGVVTPPAGGHLRRLLANLFQRRGA